MAINKNPTHPAIQQFNVFRKAKKMTVEEVSELSGVSKGSIKSYESGRVQPTLMNMTKLAIAVGCSGIGCEGFRND